jgi:hypothetical protein
LDVINVTERTGSLLSGHRKALYYSYHTTAGYLEQRLCARLNHDSHNVQRFVRSFQRLFPPNADYWHDDIAAGWSCPTIKRRASPGTPTRT